MVADGCLTLVLPQRPTCSQSWERARWGFTPITALCLFSALMIHKKHACKSIHTHREHNDRRAGKKEVKTGRTWETWGQPKYYENIDTPLKSCLQSEGISSVCRHQPRNPPTRRISCDKLYYKHCQTQKMKVVRCCWHFKTPTNFWFVDLQVLGKRQNISKRPGFICLPVLY